MVELELEARKLMSSFDARDEDGNRDGELHFHEFVAAVHSHPELVGTAALLRPYFEASDVDCDAQLSLSELQEMLKRLLHDLGVPEMFRQEIASTAEDIMTAIDSSGSGAVEFSELCDFFIRPRKEDQLPGSNETDTVPEPCGGGDTQDVDAHESDSEASEGMQWVRRGDSMDSTSMDLAPDHKPLPRHEGYLIQLMRLFTRPVKLISMAAHIPDVLSTTLKSPETVWAAQATERVSGVAVGQSSLALEVTAIDEGFLKRCGVSHYLTSTVNVSECAACQAPLLGSIGITRFGFDFCDVQCLGVFSPDPMD